MPLLSLADEIQKGACLKSIKMGNKNINYLGKEDFNTFYNRVVEIALDARNNPGKSNVSIQQLLDSSNLALKVDSTLMDAVKPALATNLYAPDKSAGDSCAACSLCAICAFCGEINGAAGALGLAGLAGFVSNSQIAVR